jgi:hypothetical protein
MNFDRITLRVRSRTPRAVAARLAVIAPLAAMVVGFSPASANGDPHRTYEPSGPIDLAAGTYCAYPVHIDWVANKEYAKVSTLPDGSTVLVLTGALIASVTNEATGRSVQVNASGPGTVTVSADGATLTYDIRGLLFLPGTNLTDLGFPSNLVVTSGPWQFVQASGFGQVLSSSGAPHLLTDVCAGLA